jgi:hypothetical protein
MAIRPACDFCNKELTDYGALLFSPPKGKGVQKYHACKACYKKLLTLRK